ncbi:hypothetical protein [Acetobacter fallax]|uniref:hypothetical protein n=1 Tax=Acetobacter fallax TaxID=1737473 RepID=UPI001A7E837C|nr:hypothetical protein [Acetobacter fallax]
MSLLFMSFFPVFLCGAIFFSLKRRVFEEQPALPRILVGAMCVFSLMTIGVIYLQYTHA